MSIPCAGGRTLLLGEFHGTAEIPGFVGDLCCRALVAKLHVVLALERGDGPAVLRYLESDGGPAARAALLGTPEWSVEAADGRSSRAMLALLERVRDLRRAGGHLDLATGASDQQMADSVWRARRAYPDAFVVLLAGNSHTRTGWGHRGASAGWHLRKWGLEPLVSLDFAVAGGTFWGISGHRGVHQIDGKNRGRRRFIRLQRDDPAFDGFFYVGNVSASPPAAELGP